MLLNILGNSLNIYLNSSFRWIIPITLGKSPVSESYHFTFEIRDYMFEEIYFQLEPGPRAMHVHHKSFLILPVTIFLIRRRQIRILYQLDTPQCKSIFSLSLNLLNFNSKRLAIILFELKRRVFLGHKSLVLDLVLEA